MRDEDVYESRPCRADVKPTSTVTCLLLRGSERNDVSDIRQIAFLLGRLLGAVEGVANYK